MEECIICFEERESIAFPCTHKVCIVCYPKLKRCPLCNYEVVVFVPNTPRVERTHHAIEVSYQPERDTRKLQLICCFIILAIILLTLHSTN